MPAGRTEGQRLAGLDMEMRDGHGRAVTEQDRVIPDVRTHPAKGHAGLSRGDDLREPRFLTLRAHEFVHR